MKSNVTSIPKTFASYAKVHKLIKMTWAVLVLPEFGLAQVLMGGPLKVT